MPISCGQPAVVQATYNVKKADFVSRKLRWLTPRMHLRANITGHLQKHRGGISKTEVLSTQLAVVMKALLARVSMVHAIGAQLCVLRMHALPRTES